MTFGARLRVIRAVRGMTQEALAEGAGISRVTLWQLESSGLGPSSDIEARLRAALGWTPEVDAALEALAEALAAGREEAA